MKKNKKFLSAIIAAVMAFGMIVVPAEALALNTPSVTKTSIAVFKVTSKNKSGKKGKVALTGLTAAGKKRKGITIGASYKLAATQSGKTYTTSGRYTVTKIAKGAFKGSKTTTIKIKGNLKPSAAKGMLQGSKAKKVTIKVPAKQVKAWKKVLAKNKNYFGKNNKGKTIKVTIKKI